MALPNKPLGEIEAVVDPEIAEHECDVLIVGGGMAACGTAFEIKKWADDSLKIILCDKASMERSGAVAQGLSAINTYIGENAIEDYVKMVRNDLMGVVREDLIYDLGRHVDESVKLFEEWGLPVWKKTEDLHNLEYGYFRKHGALVYNHLINSGKTFYCPAWRHPYIMFEKTGTGANAQYGGWYDDLEEQMPKSQNYIQTSYHYNCQFGKPISTSKKDYEDANVWRPAKTSDSSKSALMADAFSDPAKGVANHHKIGYNVVYLGGNVKFINDPEFVVRDLNNGKAYNDGLNNYTDFQAKAWRFLEERLDEDEY